MWWLRSKSAEHLNLLEDVRLEYRHHTSQGTSEERREGAYYYLKDLVRDVERARLSVPKHALKVQCYYAPDDGCYEDLIVTATDPGLFLSV